MALFFWSCRLMWNSKKNYSLENHPQHVVVSLLTNKKTWWFRFFKALGPGDIGSKPFSSSSSEWSISGFDRWIPYMDPIESVGLVYLPNMKKHEKTHKKSTPHGSVNTLRPMDAGRVLRVFALPPPTKKKKYEIISELFSSPIHHPSQNRVCFVIRTMPLPSRTTRVAPWILRIKTREKQARLPPKNCDIPTV